MSLATLSLPPSAPGTLIVLATVADSGLVSHIARSYDGLAWEGVMPTPADVYCTAVDSCTAQVSAAATTRFDTYSAQARTVNETASRFLRQATFGPTSATLHENFTSTEGVAGWIDSQMALPPTLHRAYFRKRANPKYDATISASALSLIGGSRGACAIGSRWRRFALTIPDVGASLSLTTSTENVSQLLVDGSVRSETTDLSSWTDLLPSAGPWTVCYVEEKSNGTVTLASSSCGARGSGDTTLANPPIDFVDSHPNETVAYTFASGDVTLYSVPYEPGVVVLTSVRDETCEGRADQIVFAQIEGQYYRLDERFKLVDNTLENASSVVSGGGATCPIVTKTALNEDSCVIRDTCGAVTYSSVPFTLNETNLRAFYTSAGLYVYYVDGLRLEDPYNISPCFGVSRWSPTAGACSVETALDAGTKQTLADALRNSPDANPFVRDITITTGTCYSDVDGVSSMGAKITVDDVCWEHVHPNHLDVYDFSNWALVHPGNAQVATSQIAQFAIDGDVRLAFQSSHDMLRWYDNSGYQFTYVGRLGDVADFSALPTTLQTDATAASFGSTVGGNTLYEACGSPGEVANDPLYGNIYSYWLDQYDGGKGLVFPYIATQFKRTGVVWTSIALRAEDQLRQRVAWALSQVIAKGNIYERRFTHPEEGMMSYYDIFVRNAFGNYHDVLKETSRHPEMGYWLSSEGGAGYHVSSRFPDENFAREIMQLFSIGLSLLHPNGTQQLDSAGQAIETYDANDVASCARVWAGFTAQSSRANQELKAGASSVNFVDSMIQQVDTGTLAQSKRDPFPKHNLFGGYLGDRYPLCSDAPDRDFLRTGAKYWYLGEGDTVVPKLAFESKSYMHLTANVRLTLDTSSPLYSQLCHPGGTSGACQPQSSVVLPSDLACHGTECEIEEASVIKLVSSDGTNVFYEYVPPPCAHFAFFENAVEIGQYWVNNPTKSMCADPTVRSATPVCCDQLAGDGIGDPGWLQEQYWGERTSLATNDARCAALGQMLCDSNRRWYASRDASARSSPNPIDYLWSTKACALKAQVGTSGMVNVVHDYTTATHSNGNSDWWQVDNPWTFKAAWSNGSYPLASNGCDGVCNVHGETCLCNVTVVETTAVFTNDAQPPTYSEVVAQLFIGSLAPDAYGSGVYGAGSSSTANVTVYKNASTGVLDIDTIFQVTINGAVKYLRNKASHVQFGNFTLRNVPQLMGFPHSSPRDAEYESDALLDDLFRHQNTAPFMAKHLIQRLVTSNPSPRYVEAVAQAFSAGAYGDRTYSGEYGDLGAAVAAVLLDPEARSITLDADPTHGGLREPILKIIHFMRAMDYTARPGIEPRLGGGTPLIDIIGQEPGFVQSVFNFYLPDYKPPGAVGDMALYSPEAQLAVPHFLLGWLNGMIAMVKFGLNTCKGGFSEYWGSDTASKGVDEFFPPGTGRSVCGYANSGSKLQHWKVREWADGNLTFAPQGTSSAEVIDELNVLLTSGRLNEQNKLIIMRAYEDEYASSGSTYEALLVAQYLFLATSEFHATNDNALTTTLRTLTSSSSSSGHGFKAVITLFMTGGADTYNMLVPHSECNTDSVNGLEMYASYAAVRSPLELAQSQLLEIDVPSGTQPCNKFGIHNKMPFLKELYDDGDAAFIANMGALIEPMTLAEYKAGTKARPPYLFSHNSQQEQSAKVYSQDYRNVKGVLGRIMDTLGSQTTPYRSKTYSLDIGVPDVLKSSKPVQMVTDTSFQFQELGDKIEELTANTSASIFADTWSEQLKSALNSTVEYPAKMDEVSLTASHTSCAACKKIVQLIGANSQLDNVERAAYFYSVGGFDSHKAIMPEGKLEDINSGLVDMVAGETFDSSNSRQTHRPSRHPPPPLCRPQGARRVERHHHREHVRLWSHAVIQRPGQRPWLGWQLLCSRRWREGRPDSGHVPSLSSGAGLRRFARANGTNNTMGGHVERNCRVARRRGVEYGNGAARQGEFLSRYPAHAVPAIRRGRAVKSLAVASTTGPLTPIARTLAAAARAFAPTLLVLVSAALASTAFVSLQLPGMVRKQRQRLVHKVHVVAELCWL